MQGATNDECSSEGGGGTEQQPLHPHRHCRVKKKNEKKSSHSVAPVELHNQVPGTYICYMIPVNAYAHMCGYY